MIRASPAPVPFVLPPHAPAAAHTDTQTHRHSALRFRAQQDQVSSARRPHANGAEGPQSPQPRFGGRYHTNPAISCSFYLFVLPSISSRALSSLAWASYSSSMNSCCRLRPERKESHSQSFAMRGKDQSDSISARVPSKGRCSLISRTTSCVLCCGLIHPKPFRLCQL